MKLADALSGNWDTPDGKPYQGLESYTVHHLEVGTDRELAPTQTVPGNSVGDKIDAYALDIDGYDCFSNSPQSIEIQRTRVGVWEFTGWCSDEACTTPVSEVTGIDADTTVYGKWNYSQKEVAKNEIVFYYQKKPEPAEVTYIVRYIDRETGDLIADDDWYIDIEGEIVTILPKEFDTYKPLYPQIQWQIQDDGIVIYEYFRKYDPID